MRRVALIVTVVALIAGTAIAAAQRGDAQEPSPSPSPTETASPSPVPTAVPAPAPPASPAPAPPGPASGLSAVPRIAWRQSRADGKPFAGRLANGVQLPEWGEDFITWDPVLERYPDRPWRRWGTDRLLHMLLRVASAYRTTHDSAPRLVIGDLSRPHGGPFGARFGGLGHSSHQNGLDVDVFYPRSDGLERPPDRPADVDLALAQDLVNRFLAAGAVKVFVGPHLNLSGPRGIVQKLAHHDDHMHVRIR